MELDNKRVTVIGLGNSGYNAALLLRSKGALVKLSDATGLTTDAAKRVKALEEKGIEVELGGHTESFIKSSDMIVVSPGVECDSSPMKWSVKYHIPVIGEMELGCRFCKGRIIAITGTNGKSTVTKLIGEILKNGGKDSVTCGNIGNCLCGEIERIKEDTWVALEVSSFQLETIKSFKPAISVILNITDDHMDRYKAFDDYYNQKLKIFANQDAGDYLILNYDARNLRDLKSKAESTALYYSTRKKVAGAYIDGGNIWCDFKGRREDICSVSDIPLRGMHNVENVLSAVLACTAAGVDKDPIKNAIRNFKGLAHRIELVDTIEGVEYIDDSKGTTVDSTYRALESCDRPVVLIAGGKDKHSDYSYVKDIVKKKVKAVVLIGEAAGPIKKSLKGSANIVEAGDMFEAVRMSHKIAKDGWTVLLSPMCSSFDMFSSYKERGDVFKKAVGMIRQGLAQIKA